MKPYYGMDSRLCFYDASTHQLIAGQYCTDTNAYCCTGANGFCSGTSSCVVEGALPQGTLYSYSYGASPGRDCMGDGGVVDGGP